MTVAAFVLAILGLSLSVSALIIIAGLVLWLTGHPPDDDDELGAILVHPLGDDEKLWRRHDELVSAGVPCHVCHPPTA